MSTLSRALDLSGSMEGGDLLVVWAETGGPAVAEAPEMRGFESKMIARSLFQQLGGAISYDWQPDGLVVTLRLRKDRLAA